GCRQAQLIAAMLLVSLVSYALAVEMVIRTQPASFHGFVPGIPIDVLRLFLAGLACAGLLAARIVRRAIVAGRAGMATGAPLASRLLHASIVTLSLCESIAICGLVLFMIRGLRADFYGFMAGALLGFAIYFPRRSLWEAWAQQR